MDVGQYLNPVLASVVYSVIGAVILCIAMWVTTRIIPFSVKKEIEEDQNTALGIILAAIILGLSLIISAAIQG
jgi:uncharacterized membrane protein YjfL (UPF0719 family)